MASAPCMRVGPGYSTETSKLNKFVQGEGVPVKWDPSWTSLNMSADVPILWGSMHYLYTPVNRHIDRHDWNITFPQFCWQVIICIPFTIPLTQQDSTQFWLVGKWFCNSCSGGSRISQTGEGAPIPDFGAKTYCLARYLLKTSSKWKKLDWGEGGMGRVPITFLGSASGLCMKIVLTSVRISCPKHGSSCRMSRCYINSMNKCLKFSILIWSQKCRTCRTRWSRWSPFTRTTRRYLNVLTQDRTDPVFEEIPSDEDPSQDLVRQ